MDNASVNDVVAIHMRQQLKEWGSDILDGKYLHMRCVAHIINLDVNDGLKETGVSVERVRESVRWVRATPARSRKFKDCIEFEKIVSKKFVSLDVATRWNSTYLMLESAKPFEKAFQTLARNEKKFKKHLTEKKYRNVSLGIPTSDDWSSVGRFITYLKLFYNLTVRVSGTSYVTLHLLFDEICELHNMISEWADSMDIEVCCMAERIKYKLAKYLFEEDLENSKLNRLCYMAVILDPRRKVDNLEEVLKKVYGDIRGKALVEEVKDEMRVLFDHYKHRLGLHGSSPIVIPEDEQEPS
ncbi:unnamed protein product [Linum trigynum]|uniref:hAT-like transposase RNase-H fold domain-containing protein n=1 Tax=Linum trigynum TaxID=586398 RepID=A0AAV2EDQ2_9ROSI